MAINFLNNVDYNQNQLLHAKIENQASDALAGTPVDGQLYYNTSATPGLKVGEAGAWVFVGGGVESITTANSTYVDLVDSGTAAIPELTASLSAVDGTSVSGTRFLSKDNTWDVPTYPTDANTTYSLGGVGSTNGTAGVKLTGSDFSEDDVLIVGAGTTTVTRSSNTLTVTSNDEFDGTVTSVAQTHAGNAFSVGGSPITGAGTLAIGMAGTAAQYIDGAGDLTTFPTIPTVGDGTLTVQGTGVLGGTGTFTANQSGNTTISVTHDAQSQTDTTPTITLAHGGTFTAISANVGVNASGHVTSQELTTFTLPADLEGVTSINFKTDGTALNVDSNTITTSGTMTGIWQGAASEYVNGEGDLTTFPTIPQGTMSSWELDADTGSVKTITDGETVLIEGSTYVSTNVSAPNKVTITVDASEASTPSKLIARDASGFGYVDTPSSGDNSEKIATTAFVQASLTGLLEFKGGFNASTGAIVGGGNLTSGATRVAVAVGDYYVVTADGDFFGNAATPLTTGDSVIVQTAAIAGASVEADFIVVQSDTDLATLATVGLGNVNASTLDAELGIEVSYAAGTAKVGLDIDGLTKDLLVEAASDYFLPIYDGGSGINNKTRLSELLAFGNQSTSKAGTITAGSLSGTVTHAFGVNTLVQTINSSGDTVYCDVTRTATTSVATIAVAEATDITILVQKIG